MCHTVVLENYLEPSHYLNPKSTPHIILVQAIHDYVMLCAFHRETHNGICTYFDLLTSAFGTLHSKMQQIISFPL